MALLLSLGAATGSVSDVVRVAKLLLGKDAPALPPSAGTPIERLRDHSTPPKVGLACPAAVNTATRRLMRVLFLGRSHVQVVAVS